MHGYIIIFFILLFILFLGRAGRIKVLYLKNLAFPLLCIIFILCLIIFSKTAVSSALKGIKLWLEIVFPSLFPFFIASELLNKTGFIKAMGILLEPIMRPLFNVPGCGSFAFAMGITSGYPVGAKITTELRKEKLLSKIEAERLLTFTNNSGPLFIIGAVSVGMFKIPQAGLVLLSCHIAASITVGILFGFYGRKKEVKPHIHEQNILKRFRHELFHTNPANNFGIIFGDAVRNSVYMMLVIGGFVIFFSVIINLLMETGLLSGVSSMISLMLSPLGINKEIILSILSGFFEITTGTDMASKAAGIPLAYQLTAASIIIGWAGLSIHSQVFSIISTTDISIKPYLTGKFLQGAFSGIYTWLFLKIAGTFYLKAKPVFVPQEKILVGHWYNNLLNSFMYLLASLLILVCLSLVSRVFSYLRHGK